MGGKHPALFLYMEVFILKEYRREASEYGQSEIIKALNKVTGSTSEPDLAGGKREYTNDASENGQLQIAEAISGLAGSATMETELDKKQNKLTFDTAPTQNSTNPVTSGGVYTALGVVGTDGNYILASNSVAQNLIALDTAIGTISQALA